MANITIQELYDGFAYDTDVLNFNPSMSKDRRSRKPFLEVSGALDTPWLKDRE